MVRGVGPAPSRRARRVSESDGSGPQLVDPGQFRPAAPRVRARRSAAACSPARSRPAALSANVRRSSRMRSANRARICRWTSSSSDARRPSASNRTSSTNPADERARLLPAVRQLAAALAEDLLATEHRDHPDDRRAHDGGPEQRPEHARASRPRPSRRRAGRSRRSGPTSSDPRTSARRAHNGSTSKATRTPSPSRPTSSSASSRAIVGLDRGRAVGRCEERGPGPRPAVSCWIRWLTSGQACAGSIVSISSCVSRRIWRIRAWKANSVRVRRAANSSSSRTDQRRRPRRGSPAGQRIAAQVGGLAARPPPVARARRARRRPVRAAGRWPAGAGRRRGRARAARARRTASPTSASAKRG